MKDVRIVQKAGKLLALDPDEVFGQLDCRPDNPLYDAYVKEYKELRQPVLDALCPRAAVAFRCFPDAAFGESGEGCADENIKPGSPAAYVILTVGDGAADISDDFFSRGEYVKSMLADAIGVAAVFAFEKIVLDELRSLCKTHQVGVSKRLEVPQHLPMEMMRVVFEALRADQTLGMRMTNGQMYEPRQSMCLVFALCGDEQRMELLHDCKSCQNHSCSLREQLVKVTVSTGDSMRELMVKRGTNLLQALQEQGMLLEAPCGGKGTCGKCRVQLFSESTKKEQVVLACDTKADSDLTVFFVPYEGAGACICSADPASLAGAAGAYGTQAVGVGGRCVEPAAAALPSGAAEDGKPEAGLCTTTVQEGYGIAIDLGTTTLVFALVRLADGERIDTAAGINPQVSFGADVMTRIDAAVQGREDAMRCCVRDALLAGICSLLWKNGIAKSSLCAVCVAGNTTMLHFLRGYPVGGLGSYPFSPVTLALETCSFAEVFPAAKEDAFKDIPVYILPGISAFVGADVAAGLYRLGFCKMEKNAALIDLGTNGEMAVGNGEHILVASAAAGPAFEGGNIRCGTGSVQGAICDASLVRVAADKYRVKLQTIGGKEPVGLCGTGAVAALAELRRQKLVDAQGCMACREKKRREHTHHAAGCA